MNNKEKLINAVDKDLNKNNNLNIINKKIDKSYKFNNILKYAFVPSLILIFSIVSLSITEKEISLEDNNNNNLMDTSQNIIINDVNIPVIKNNPFEDSLTTEKSAKDKVIKAIDGYDFYKDLNISDEYNAFIMYEVYVKESEEDIECAIQKLMNSNKNKILVIVQTTFSLDKFNKIVDSVSKEIKEDINSLKETVVY